MTLNRIVIPTQCPTPDKVSTVTLIHGWGAESRVWVDWATEALAPFHQVVLIDLPGFGDSPALPNSETIEEDWLAALAEALPEKTHLLGWSLGGLLAQQLAYRYPEKVQSLVCLASTPRFTQNEGWQLAVSPEMIAEFMQAIGIEVGRVLKQFWRLQLQGADNARPLMKQLVLMMSGMVTPSLDSLLQGLVLLKEMDNRDILAKLTQPTCWVLGEKDPLIPHHLQTDLANLQPSAFVQVVEGGSHVPFFSHPTETQTPILAFWHRLDHLEK